MFWRYEQPKAPADEQFVRRQPRQVVAHAEQQLPAGPAQQAAFGRFGVGVEAVLAKHFRIEGNLLAAGVPGAAHVGAATLGRDAVHGR
nr:hypothetical protein [Tanacetum cinerariifolium]